MGIEFETTSLDLDHSGQFRYSLKTWFLITFVAGAVAMIVEYLVGVPFVGLVGSLVSMGIYMSVGQRRRAREIGVQQFADSVYYQGFLFTLFALVLALIKVAASGLLDPLQVASQFGIALVTTLVGLTLRVYLTNFRNTVEDTYQRTEEALERAFQRLRSDLDEVSINLVQQSSFLKLSMERTSQVTEETMKGLISEMRDSLSQAVAATNEALIESTEALKMAATQMTTNMQSAHSTALTKLVENTEAGAELLETSVQGLSTRLDGLTIPDDVFTSKLELPLAALSQNVSEVADTIGDFKDLPDALKDGADQLQLAVNDLHRAIVGTLEKLHSVPPLVQKLSKGTSEVGHQGTRLSTVSKQLESQVRSVGTQTALLTESSDQLDGKVKTLIAEESRRIEERTREADKALGDFGRQLQSAAEFLRKNLGTDQ